MANIYVRPATRNEVPIVTQIRIDAFGENESNRALMPDPVRRAIDFPIWRLAHMQDSFADPGRHIVVAVEPQDDGTETVAGSAEWIAPGGPTPGLTPEERAAIRERRRALAPSSLDLDAMDGMNKAVDDGVKKGFERAGLSPDADKDMWDLVSLAVDSKYQRRGIGQKLVQWGVDQASDNNKGVLIVANPTGAPLYRKMGFEEIGKFAVHANTSTERDSWVFIQRRPE